MKITAQVSEKLIDHLAVLWRENFPSFSLFMSIKRKFKTLLPDDRSNKLSKSDDQECVFIETSYYHEADMDVIDLVNENEDAFHQQPENILKEQSFNACSWPKALQLHEIKQENIESFVGDILSIRCFHCQRGGSKFPTSNAFEGLTVCRQCASTLFNANCSRNFDVLRCMFLLDSETGQNLETVGHFKNGALKKFGSWVNFLKKKHWKLVNEIEALARHALMRGISVGRAAELTCGKDY